MWEYAVVMSAEERIVHESLRRGGFGRKCRVERVAECLDQGGLIGGIG